MAGRRPDKSGGRMVFAACTEKLGPTAEAEATGPVGPARSWTGGDESVFVAFAVVVVELGARNAGDAQTPATRSVRDLPRVIPEGVVDIEVRASAHCMPRLTAWRPDSHRAVHAQPHTSAQAQRPQQTGSLADRRAEYSVPRVLASTEHVGDRSSRVAGAQPDARPNIRAAAPAEVQAPVGEWGCACGSVIV